MTLDEAIKHAWDKSSELYEEVENWVHCPNDPNKDKDLKDFEDCKECANEHRQLYAWLKDLERLTSHQKITSEYRTKSGNLLCFYHETPEEANIRIYYIKESGRTKYLNGERKYVCARMSYEDFCEWCESWEQTKESDANV